MDRDYERIHREVLDDSHDLRLGFNQEIDEGSGQEDPELAVRNSLAKSNEALADNASFVEAVATTLDNRGVAIDLERPRMQTEDFRARFARHS